MGRIELKGIAHTYGPGPEEDFALKPLDLVWEAGGAYALLGPSGCGKTTLLNIISGLTRPTRGSISIDGRDVTTASPQERNIAQVFQFPVIYDTMTVGANLAFPLRNRRVAADEIKRRVGQIAEILELSADLDRRASGLTADMKQRISLGRGLVRRDVAAILLDEPLTVIDPHSKSALRRKLMQVHEELQVTLIYVTHDQNEAMTLADTVLVMNLGRVLQAGTPQELFERPGHTFVGYFIGSPGMNVLPCTIDGSTAVLGKAGGQKLALSPETANAARGLGGDLALGVRPEFVRVSAGGPGLRGTVSRVDHLGHFKLATVDLGGQTIAAKLPEDQALDAGAACLVVLPLERTMLYADGKAVGAVAVQP